MSQVMSVNRLARQISRGYGAGRHDSYTSWIRIRRKLSSPVSNLQALCVPQYERALQLLSGLERVCALVLLWLGCIEIREQYPLWPYAHAHPLIGTRSDVDRLRRPVRGLLSICKEHGINHGVYPGTGIPFVATIDFAVTLGEWSSERLALFSCKPRALLDAAGDSSRMHERILMERLYARQVSATHTVVDGTLFSEVLQRQLDWLLPKREDVQRIDKDRLQKYAHELMLVADCYSLKDAKRIASNAAGLTDFGTAETFFRLAAWQGLLDIDLGQEIQSWKPIRRDVRGFKESLRQALLNGTPECEVQRVSS